MLKQILTLAALAGFLIIADNIVFAVEPKASPPATVKKQELIYGSQLMTKQERIEHRSKMRAASTDEEREQIRKAHHERMKERAKERGVTLPDNPPAGGGGRGQYGGR